MNKLSKPHSKLSVNGKILLKSIAYFICIFLLISLIYFLFLLKPALDSAKSLSEAEVKISTQQFILQQNKTAHLGLLQLDIKSPQFTVNQQNLTESLDNSEAIILNSQNKSELKSISGNKSTKVLLNEINKDLPSLNEKSIETVNRRQPFEEDYKKLNLIFGKIFEYNPSVDLANFNDLESLGERAASAAKGLNGISDELKKEKLKGELTVQFDNEINKEVLILEQLSMVTKNNNTARAKTLANSFISEYPKLKMEAKKILDSPLKSLTALTILTDETNLILNYEYLNNKINKAQQNIETNPLSKIFQSFK